MTSSLEPAGWSSTDNPRHTSQPQKYCIDVTSLLCARGFKVIFRKHWENISAFNMYSCFLLHMSSASATWEARTTFVFLIFGYLDDVFEKRLVKLKGGGGNGTQKGAAVRFRPYTMMRAY
jgi:hypothetical protein